METSIHLKPAVNFKPGGVRTGDLSVRPALACTVPSPNLIGARENIQVFNRKEPNYVEKDCQDHAVHHHRRLRPLRGNGFRPPVAE